MRCGDAWRALALAALSLLSGCDPTSGLASTADAALPTVKRYFDGQGTKLSEGPWSRVVVDLDAETLYHVGARRLDDAEPTFHLFGVDAQEGCSVTPNAGTWLMGKPRDAPFRLLPYLEDIDDRGRGRLRFTTLDCQVQDIVVEGAGRPYPRLLDHGYLVPTKEGYSFVDPWSGEVREIAERLHEQLVWDDKAVLFWADEKLKSFSDQFEPQEEFGEGVSAVLELTDAFLIEDASGLSRVAFDRETLTLTPEPVLPGACHLQKSRLFYQDGKNLWLTLSDPCDSERPSTVRVDSESFEVLERVEWPVAADARHARTSVKAEEGDAHPVSFFYSTDIDEQDGLGTVWAWQVDAEAPVLLGERAKLDAAFLETSESDWDLVAQVNYQRLGSYWAHDRVHFKWDGTVEGIAERIVRDNSSGEVLVNFDGVTGDLVLFSDEGPITLAQAVPPSVGEQSSFTTPRRYARMDNYDGQTGRVLLSNDSEDVSQWDPVTSNATAESLRFAWFMPAVMFLENWDDESRTGSLVAYNYELDARATISDGVSSFDLTSYPWDGVVYSVPNGKRQGVWFSRAK